MRSPLRHEPDDELVVNLGNAPSQSETTGLQPVPRL